ncbi:MAG: hypothetical protein L6Q55_07290 [Azonexus sp.]|nr:hypothetical protein [Azonexus sp.]MCK6412213.1 hypothetical protein [Azonexus sp.]
MHKKIFAGLMFATLSAAAMPVLADGFKLFPILQPGFKAEPTVAVTAGMMKVSGNRDDQIGVYGLEFSMNCGLFQTADQRIRTHLAFNRADESGLKYTSLELSPRYTVPLGGGFSFGAGPALAWVKADVSRGDKDLFGYGAAAGVAYRSGAYFSGLDLRYLNTDRREEIGLENWAVNFKLGVNF